MLNCCILFYNCAEQKPNNDSNNGDQKTSLNAALAAFNIAFSTGDLVVLDSMVVDTYKHTNGTSKAINKEAWFDYLRKRRKDLDTGKLVVLDYKMYEKEVEFHENSAIVSAKVVVKSNVGGEVRENEYRVTNVWVYTTDQWKRVAFHDTKIK